MTFGVAQRAIVVDASASIELLLGDADWIARWRAWTESGDLLVVPAHFGHEMANALLRGVGLPPGMTTAAIERLFASGLDVIDRGVRGLLASVQLAAEHGLTVYDAAYLELALDLDAELATLDAALQAAATSEGVPLTV